MQHQDSARNSRTVPGDGSNGPDVLGLTGVVRSDIRPSFAGLSGTADGISLTIALTIVSASTCEPLAGRAVYLWHCDRLGRYSLYSAGATDQNYLRGVQEAGPSGTVTFTSIFPGCYSGRWPHIHFEVYPSLSGATNVANKIATSQIALPKAACDEVYATAGYETSVTNLSRVSLATDNVFSDGSALELATITGSVGGGLTAALTVAIWPQGTPQRPRENCHRDSEFAAESQGRHRGTERWNPTRAQRKNLQEKGKRPRTATGPAA